MVNCVEHEKSFITSGLGCCRDVAGAGRSRCSKTGPSCSKLTMSFVNVLLKL